jgi:copper(I)-binding protein
MAVWVPMASAHSYKLGDIAIGHVWAPPPEKGATGVPVYGPILNRGETTVRLVGASTPMAEQVRFRTEKNGEVRWREAIKLSPGKPLALAPWREHIWLSGLKKPLKEGDSFDLILDFGGAGQLMVKIVVETATGH